MAETLGSLCDKLTIVKLKEYHTDDDARIRSLNEQEKLLCEEIDTYINDAVTGRILVEKLVFPQNKVYMDKGNETRVIEVDDIGSLISGLATINCKLWHVQEKIYAFGYVGPEEKDEVVRQASIFNLQRNQYIEEIDNQFKKAIKSVRKL
jgi:hypothetical protein